jgi:hypothetical protein
MTPEEIARVLIDSGYRKTSNKYRIVARVDVEQPPKECFSQHHGGYFGDDYYRRCHSKDKLVLPYEVFRLIPTSGHSDTGCMPRSAALPEALAAAKVLEKR